MASSRWPEITTASSESRRELVLTGAEVSKRIENGGLDEGLYGLNSLNFLEISRTCLSQLSAELGKLHNLTNLVLHTNKLTSLPDEILQLTKLKFLDVSSNQLTVLPDGICELVELQSFNVSSNKLSEIPSLSQLSQLHVLDFSSNELIAFPDGLDDGSLSLLAQINASSNRIKVLPAGVSDLPSLKTFDISDNALVEIPAEFGECGKLKDFICKGNKLKDRRLGKMLDQCKTKSVLDYLRNILEKEQAQQRQKGQAAAKGKKKKKGKGKEEEARPKNTIYIEHYPESGGVLVQSTPAAAEVRPYIVCCVVKHLDLMKSNNMFKRFIALQTRLHDTLGQKRQAATIATHDLEKIKGPLVYSAEEPDKMKLTPLNKVKEVSALKLVSKLRQEAEEMRKEKKRNTVSGIHKYLDLLKGKLHYPCLVDSENTIISFPPITNCDKTKVSKETSDILVEVTSSTDLNICKKILDELLQGLLEMGVGTKTTSKKTASDTESGSESDSKGGAAGGAAVPGGLENLTVQQVKVMDIEGGLKVMYPSRADLLGDVYSVVRD